MLIFSLKPKGTPKTVMKCNYLSDSDYETKKRWKIALLDKWAFKYPCLINFKEEQKKAYGYNYWIKFYRDTFE